MPGVADGCELCGDWPLVLIAKCHPSAPLRVEYHEDGTLKLYCYLPTCNRLVTTLQVTHNQGDPD